MLDALHIHTRLVATVVVLSVSTVDASIAAMLHPSDIAIFTSDTVEEVGLLFVHNWLAGIVECLGYLCLVVPYILEVLVRNE